MFIHSFINVRDNGFYGGAQCEYFVHRTFFFVSFSVFFLIFYFDEWFGCIHCVIRIPTESFYRFFMNPVTKHIEKSFKFKLKSWWTGYYFSLSFIGGILCILCIRLVFDNNKKCSKFNNFKNYCFRQKTLYSTFQQVFFIVIGY